MTYLEPLILTMTIKPHLWRVNILIPVFLLVALIQIPFSATAASEHFLTYHNLTYADHYQFSIHVLILLGQLLDAEV